MTEKKSIPVGEAFTESARWLNSVWTSGKTGKAAILTAGVFTPFVLLIPAVGYCLGAAKLDAATKPDSDDDAPSKSEALRSRKARIVGTPVSSQPEKFEKQSAENKSPIQSGDAQTPPKVRWGDEEVTWRDAWSYVMRKPWRFCIGLFVALVTLATLHEMGLTPEERQSRAAARTTSSSNSTDRAFEDAYVYSQCVSALRQAGGSSSWAHSNCQRR